MASDWNRLLERLLALNLTQAETRLALAIARQLLGWNRTSAPLGQRLLRDTAGLDGRSFKRALQGLVEKGYVSVNGGGPGRGKRTTYTLHLDTEKPAQERAITGVAKPAPQRAIPTPVKARSQDKKSPPHSGHALVEAGVRTPPTLNSLAFDAYAGAGGPQLLDRERGALAHSVKTAHAAGATDTEIVAAARDLGRQGEFPGLLKQRIAEHREHGGACNWPGLDRSRLTPAQLAECPCSNCTEWATAAKPPAPQAQMATAKTHSEQHKHPQRHRSRQSRDALAGYQPAQPP
jgi:hypothetical protein